MTTQIVMAHELPTLAISVRQPWAWALIHAGKDCENRSAAALRHMPLPPPGRRLTIHAAKGMTREEYEDGADFMETLGVIVLKPGDLLRGCIMGDVAYCGQTSENASSWFFGPRAIIVGDPRYCDPIYKVGALGLFRWRDAARCEPAPLAKWMQGTPVAPPVADGTLL